MKVFVVGATGVLGRETVSELLARGHQVTALARTPQAERTLQEKGVTAVRGDLMDAGSLARGAAGCEAVFHLATRIPQKPIPKAKDLEETNILRTEGTYRLVAAAKNAGARALLFQSIAYIFADHGGAEVTEDSPAYEHTFIRPALEGEEITLNGGLRGVVLRGGYFFHPEAWHTRWMADALRKRQLPVIGRGDYFLQPVHPRDLARAFVLAAEKEDARGLYHVAAQPVEARIFFGEWARRLGARPPRRVPYFLARFAMGEFAKMTKFRYRVSSEKIKRQLGFTFQFPTYREILDALSS